MGDPGFEPNVFDSKLLNSITRIIFPENLYGVGITYSVTQG